MVTQAFLPAAETGVSAPSMIVPRRKNGQYVLTAVVLLVLATSLVSVITNERFGWDIVARYLFGPTIIAGIGHTLVLTVVAMVLGAALGGVLALMRLSANRPLQSIAHGYIWFFRGVPLLVQLIFWFNLAALFPDLGFGLPGMDPVFSFNANDVISPFTAAVLALSLHEAAYMAEIIRSGVGSVDHGQREAAQALGIKPRKVMLRIILPQAMRVIVPPTANQVIMMLKTTSLVSVIALSDLLYSAQIIYSSNYQVIPLLLVASLWYLALVSVLTVGQHQIERIYNRGYGTRSTKRRPRRILPTTKEVRGA